MTLLAGYMTSGTWWIFPMKPLGTEPRRGRPVFKIGGVEMIPATLQAFRASCLTTGRFRTAQGSSPSFDPATALYATSDMVTNLAAVGNVTIYGDVASSRRLLECEHNWKTFLDVDQMLAHKSLGKTMPSKDRIIAAYADDPIIEA
jgi:hypothetical protein